MNKKHNHEPVISIGLILPEDNQKNVSITLFGEKFDLLIDNVKKAEFKNDFNIGLWVVADNLRKGAALNSIQIGEALVKKFLK